MYEAIERQLMRSSRVRLSPSEIARQARSRFLAFWNRSSMSNDFSIIGKPIAMVDAAGKTTGAGKYTDDLSLPGMLVGKILHSPYPHARIKSIDTSRARSVEGVVAWSPGRTRRTLTAFCPWAMTRRRWLSTKCDMWAITLPASLP